MPLPRETDLPAMMAAITVPAYVVDVAALRFMAWNSRFEEFLGYSAAELQEISIEAIRPPEDIPLLHTALRNLPPRGFSDWRYRRKDGSVIHARLHYRHIECLRDGGEVTQCRCVVVEYWSTRPLMKHSAHTA